MSEHTADDVTVIGPECFTNGEVISYKGENYIRQSAASRPKSDDCRHENVRTFRSIPPRRECRDCGATVERQWVRVTPPEEDQP